MTQAEALEILNAGRNVFLTGAPGSGKTYLLNEYIRSLKAEKVGVGITAATGIAATHIGGLTIHSWAGIGIHGRASDDEVRVMAANRRIAKRFQRTRVLVIDEISMLDADRLDLVERMARLARGSWEPFGGLQVILCGDFFQLPPVAKEGEPPPAFAHHARAWKELDITVCYLHERHRHADPNLCYILDAIRSALPDEAVRARLLTRLNARLPSERITKLYTHNADVDAENRRELRRLPGEEHRYRMAVRGVRAVAETLKKGCLAPEELVLKAGAKVMFVKNNFGAGYVNGTLGTVVGFAENGYPVVRTFGGDEITAEPAAWSIEENGRKVAEITQVPLRLAWAITIHKSQGMTLDAAEIDLAGAFEPGMGYVALSRVRSLEGIRLLGLNDTALRVHPEILDFDHELRSRSDEAARALPHAPRRARTETRPKIYSVAKIRETHPAAYQKWSPAEEEQLAAGYRSGVKTGELARALGRKRGAIRARLEKMGLAACHGRPRAVQ